ncbi:MAG: hypothetical protein ACTS1X_10085, partial [Parasphingopyxis sp.]
MRRVSDPPLRAASMLAAASFSFLVGWSMVECYYTSDNALVEAGFCFVRLDLSVERRTSPHPLPISQQGTVEW